MEKGTEILLNYGIAGVVIAACFYAIYRGAKWFLTVHLPKMQEDRAKETQAIIAQFEALRVSTETQSKVMQAQLERLIQQQEKVAETQAENEKQIVTGLKSLRESVTKGFADFGQRLSNVESRVHKLETVNPK